YKRGQVLLVLGYLEDALADCRRCAQMRPDFTPVYWLQSRVLLASRQVDDALRTIDRALLIQPNRSCLLYAKSRALFETGRFRESAEAISEAIRLKPGCARYHFARAQMGIYGSNPWNPELAIPDLDLSITLRPHRNPSYYERGVIRLILQ